MHKELMAAALLCLAEGCATAGGENAGAGVPATSAIQIGPFSAREAAHHQGWIQTQLDQAAGTSRVFVFAPGEYVLSDPQGVRVPDGATLILDGAAFVFAEAMDADGQAFLLDNVSNVSLCGGEIRGRRDAWDPGVNIAGVRAYGSGQNLRISGLRCTDLSSNAVGVFGESDEAPFRNVTLSQIEAVNCCNFYGDYLQPNVGPAPGSDRKDQGGVAFYFVDGWLVDGCRFEKSQSDGTHFFHAHNGRFANSVVARSQMGGYFLEGCRQVIASGNLVLGNGSRGVTIERDSRCCTLVNNIVEGSGREGLWAPDVAGIIVASNIFRENGRKDDGERDCEIRLDDTDGYATHTREIRIEGNVFYTSEHQTAAIYLGQGVEPVPVDANTFSGPAPACAVAPGTP
ncbi:MAG: right-handed parallel beta-helix repeat-containing protein [Candidatus Hydrogenedentes bacterium]|nr:right-handed parallel beta-helix repeat-containing protein [Candidatus Hydrogenedentota bacterium]